MKRTTKNVYQYKGNSCIYLINKQFSLQKDKYNDLKDTSKDIAVCLQQVFQQSFDPVDNVEGLEMRQ